MHELISYSPRRAPSPVHTPNPGVASHIPPPSPLCSTHTIHHLLCSHLPNTDNTLLPPPSPPSSTHPATHSPTTRTSHITPARCLELHPYRLLAGIRARPQSGSNSALARNRVLFAPSKDPATSSNEARTPAPGGTTLVENSLAVPGCLSPRALHRALYHPAVRVREATALLRLEPRQTSCRGPHVR